MNISDVLAQLAKVNDKRAEQMVAKLPDYVKDKIYKMIVTPDYYKIISKGKNYKEFLWNDKVRFVINEKIMKIMKDYVVNERNGVGLGEKDVGSKKWEWAFWSDLLGVMSDGHV